MKDGREGGREEGRKEERKSNEYEHEHEHTSSEDEEGIFYRAQQGYLGRVG